MNFKLIFYKTQYLLFITEYIEEYIEMKKIKNVSRVHTSGLTRSARRRSPTGPPSKEAP